jgi:hypothetical protein
MTTRNLRLVDKVAAVASKAGATPAQVALARPLQSMLACMFSQRPCHLGRVDLPADLLKLSCATDGLAMDRIL